MNSRSYFTDFTSLRDYAHYLMREVSEIVKPLTWQSRDVSDKPEMATHEVFNFYGGCDIRTTDIPTLQADCRPNLPWAEDHFHERVCGEPLNPGYTWQQWPYAHKADTFRDANGQFNHNYMERMWPRYAGMTDQGEIFHEHGPQLVDEPHLGIRHRYGDLQDVVALFVRDPLTRQAFLPIFFPEDTGAHHGGRIPCTLGYQFIIRQQQLHVVYFMRSCDLMRHFNDDCYLTARLAIWLLHQLRAAAPDVFNEVQIGTFTIHATSLHIFRNDWFQLYGDTPVPGAALVKIPHEGTIGARLLDDAVFISHGHVQIGNSGEGGPATPGTTVGVASGPLPRGYSHGGHPINRELLGGEVPNFPGARKPRG